MRLTTIAAALLALTSFAAYAGVANVPRDTSFTVNSAVAKIKKQVPEATAARVKNLPMGREVSGGRFFPRTDRWPTRHYRHR